MQLRALYFLGCLLIFSGACGFDDSDNSGSEFELIDHIDLVLDDAGSPDAGTQDSGTPDADNQDTQTDHADAADSDTPGFGIGEVCASDEDCLLGRCLNSEPFIDGYCSTPDACEFDDHCPVGSTTCFENGEDGEDAFCGARCEEPSDCRDGYSCQESAASPFKACAPEVSEPSHAGIDGAACESDSDCEGSYCLEDPNWPGGYCTTVQCETFVDCARGEGENEVDNRCLQQQGGTNFCVRMCQRSQDCREDYICQYLSGNEGYCSPDPQADFDPDNIEDYPFEITCGLESENNKVTIEYQVAADTTSYMITPFALDRKAIRPARTLFPDTTQVDYSGANSFQSVPSQIFKFVNPILTPPVEQFSGHLQSGEHSLELNTQSNNICYYVLQESTPGDTIDFNIYLVGIGKTAEEAETDTDLQAVLDQFDVIYAEAGVSIGEVRFHEITGEDADAYQIVRSDLDVQELVALSTLPEGGYDGALSANIFFVRSMQLDGGGGGAIGISQGLPGAAGLHGTPSSGVIFTSEYIGEQFQGGGATTIEGNDFTGIVMAHEVGHYLGLFHTSEQYGQGFDPVLDTPRCTNPNDFPDDCPDLNNLMFPLAGISHTELTPGQVFTLQANPLTKDK